MRKQNQDTSAQDVIDRRADRIAKLPAWAREEIENLTRERENAVRALAEHIDKQTPSPFYREEMVSDGAQGPGPSRYRFYVQGHDMLCEAHGIKLRICTAYGSTNENSITLQWEGAARDSSEVGFIPHSYQMARLVARSKMR